MILSSPKHLKKVDIPRFPVFSNEAMQERNSFTVNEQLKYAPLHKTVDERTSSEAGAIIIWNIEDI